MISKAERPSPQTMARVKTEINNRSDFNKPRVICNAKGSHNKPLPPYGDLLEKYLADKYKVEL